MKKLIILVGPPGSGKSTMAQKLVEEGYARISQDDMGRSGHLEALDNELNGSNSIVVDRMNFSVGQRKHYLDKAKSYGYETKIIVLHQPRKVCYERMLKRENHPTIKDSSTANSALNTFFSKYERPLPGEADHIEFVYPEGDKPSAVICDLDGTLCDLSDRLHHVKKPQGERKNWKGFFEELENDKPHSWCEAILRGLYWNEKNPVKIVYASGRPDDYERKTRAWLTKHALDFEPYDLYMRCRGDHRQDYIAKEIILDFEILTRFKPLFFIDDRKQVVDFWRSRGYTCLQCNEGDF